MASEERSPIMGSGANPPVGSRGRAPGQGKLKRFKLLDAERKQQILPFFVFYMTDPLYNLP